MARTALTKVTAPGGYSGAGVAFPLAAGDAVNGNYFEHTGREIIVVKNANASSPGVSRTVTLVSVNDPYGRTEDIAEVLAAGDIKVYGPFPILGWRQTDYRFYINVDSSDLQISVLELLQ